MISCIAHMHHCRRDMSFLNIGNQFLLIAAFDTIDKVLEMEVDLCIGYLLKVGIRFEIGLSNNKGGLV